MIIYFREQGASETAAETPAAAAPEADKQVVEHKILEESPFFETIFSGWSHGPAQRILIDLVDTSPHLPLTTLGLLNAIR